MKRINIGEKILKARKEASFSQQKLALRIGISRQQVQKYEKNINNIASTRLDKVAKILNKPINYFFE